MTTSKQAFVVAEAILVTMVFAPFYLWRLPAALWEAAAFSARFQRPYASMIGPVLRANAAGSLLGGLVMFGICLLVYSGHEDWLFEWRQAFGIFAFHPWLQLFGMLAYLGICLLLTARVESALLRRSPALAEVADIPLIGFRRRLHYVSFGLFTLLPGWQCWHFLHHPPVGY